MALAHREVFIAYHQLALSLGFVLLCSGAQGSLHAKHMLYSELPLCALPLA